MNTRKKMEKTKTNTFGAIEVQMWCKWNSAVYLNGYKQYIYWYKYWGKLDRINNKIRL